MVHAGAGQTTETEFTKRCQGDRRSSKDGSPKIFKRATLRKLSGMGMRSVEIVVSFLRFLRSSSSHSEPERLTGASPVLRKEASSSRFRFFPATLSLGPAVDGPTAANGGMHGSAGMGVGLGSKRSILRDEFHIGSGVSSWVRSRRKPRLVVGVPEPSAVTCGRVGGDVAGGGSKTGVGRRAGESGALVTEDILPVGELVRSRDDTLEELPEGERSEGGYLSEEIRCAPQQVGRFLSSGSIWNCNL
ncbi:hypothetical protein EDB92DRAFT_1855772 [Lactarius akahatsu]|uniref:Uncharacterized protein n=1 Tax=Lactarius akahatsu TaxID=416441 RepID=A0AAD4LI14_9AGAM|nr:hypothetical protein EDB92DRAFT_1855772 [Lactarius akahatsu]